MIEIAAKLTKVCGITVPACVVSTGFQHISFKCFTLVMKRPLCNCDVCSLRQRGVIRYFVVQSLRCNFFFIMHDPHLPIATAI